jgi:hypothetical protein
MKRVKLTESDLRRIINRILKEDEIDLKSDFETIESHSDIPGCDPSQLNFQRCTTEAFKKLPADKFLALFTKLSNQSDVPLENPMEKMSDMMESRIRRKYRY